MPKKFTAIFLAVLVLLNGTLWLAVSTRSSNSTQNSEIIKYPYLSRRIFNDNQNDILLNFVALRKQLKEKFEALPAGTDYSFYFEYLPSGTSIRIGESNELIAASLIKVPLVMNLYRAAELGKLDLDSRVTIKESELDDAYGDLWQRGAGAQFTLRQLAEYALEESDNTATRAIYDNVTSILPEEEQSLAQLDVDQNLENGQAVINARSFTSVLKSLYFASYINRSNSNEILGYLSKSAEHNRLTKLLPKSVKVAHKNGVYNKTWAESDCGIVYVERRPYAACIMVGLPDAQANTFIADVSDQIYKYVTRQ